MTIYNIPYNQQTDPKALFAQGFENMLGGIMQGREKKRLGEAISNMDPNATPIEVAMKLLSERISPQIAMGMGGLQQSVQSRKSRFGVTPWYLSPEWANTTQGIKAREKAFEGMTREERIKALQSGLNAAAGQYFYQEGLEGGAQEPKNPVLYDFYADLLREEGIPVKQRPGSQTNGRVLPQEGTKLVTKTGPQAEPSAGPQSLPQIKSTGGKTSVTDKYPAPKTKAEFDATLAGIEAGGNEEEADFYYEKHWKPSYGTHRQ